MRRRSGLGFDRCAAGHRCIHDARRSVTRNPTTQLSRPGRRRVRSDDGQLDPAHSHHPGYRGAEHRSLSAKRTRGAAPHSRQVDSDVRGDHRSDETDAFDEQTSAIRRARYEMSREQLHVCHSATSSNHLGWLTRCSVHFFAEGLAFVLSQICGHANTPIPAASSSSAFHATVQRQARGG